MKRLLSLLCLPPLLAACALSEIPQEPGPAGAPATPSVSGPLVVPPLSALPDTPPRSLAGRYQRAAWAELPGWSSDDLSQLWPLFLRNCKGLMRPTTGNLAAPARATPRAWQPVCAAAADPAQAPSDAAGVRRFLQAHLQPWRVNGADNRPATNTVTGYYEPLVRGHVRREGPYQVPLYRQPPDLVQVDLGEFRDSLRGQRIAGRVRDGRLRPYEDRGAIEAGALQGKNLELVWLDDASDAFFLQVQGSGLVQLPDGRLKRVGFAAQNGHPYVALGKVMIERGLLPREDVTMQSIRAWLRANPSAAPELLKQNPSYVFFRELPPPKDDSDGPLGAQGVALLPGRSLAVDRSHFALGMPLWLAATHPDPQPPHGEKPLRRLMVMQDTGGAIRGAVRGDVFWGHGAEAEAIAGRMKHPGRYWLLLPKPVAAALTASS